MNRMLLSNPRLARSFGNLATDVENMVDRLFGDTHDDSGGSMFVPRLDVLESDSAFEVHVDLPGVKPDDVSVEVKEDQLTIAGSRQRMSEEGNRRYHRVERMNGAFTRTVVLPSSVDHDKIEADYSHGVLHITLPKAVAAQPRKIQIRTETSKQPEASKAQSDASKAKPKPEASKAKPDPSKARVGNKGNQAGRTGTAPTGEAGQISAHQG